MHGQLNINIFTTYFRKISNIKFYEDPCKGERRCSMRADGGTDRHEEANSRFSQFCEHSKKLQHRLRVCNIDPCDCLWR